MTALQLMAWVQVAQVLIGAGVATAEQIAGWIKQVHGTAMPEAELNAICTYVVSDAARRKALADADMVAVPA